MSPLRLEVLNNRPETVAARIIIMSKDDPGTITNILPDGSKQTLVFQCSPDDSSSTVKLINKGFNESENIPNEDVENAEVIATLRKGDLPFRFDVRIEGRKTKRKLRFTHI